MWLGLAVGELLGDWLSSAPTVGTSLIEGALLSSEDGLLESDGACVPCEVGTTLLEGSPLGSVEGPVEVDGDEVS